MAGLLDGFFGPRAQAPGSTMGGGLRGLLAPEVALPMAAALMGNQGNMQNIGNAFALGGAQMAKTAGKNRTYNWLQQNAPEFAQLMDGGLDGQSALELYAKQRFAEPTLTDDIREYRFGQQDPAFLDHMTRMKQAGATNITVDGGKYGTIPQGYMLKEGPDGVFYEAIPGGPADTSKTDERASGQADVATRVVTSAASRARDAAKNRNLGHFGQGVMSNLPWTDSAEVFRQVEVLKSQAKVENLNQMRQASPTGGALGSVTEKEAEMLAAKSGALDPSSPNFQRDLDDYELTLLQVVHGPQVGAQIFQATRGGGGFAPAAPSPPQGGNTTRSGVQWSVGP